MAFALAYESRGLLIGESASPDVVASIREIAAKDASVCSVRAPLTMHLGPQDVLLNLEVSFHRTASAREQLDAVERIENAVRSRHPQITRIFIEARRDAAGLGS